MRRKYIIKNETKYRTQDLRRMVVATFKQHVDDDKLPRITVTFVPARKRWVSGRARLHSSFMRVCVPSEGLDRIDLAMVILHEAAHCWGLDHPQMRGNAHYNRLPATPQLFAFAEGIPVEKRPEVRRARRTKLDNHERDERLLYLWRKKLERAERAIKKIQTRMKRRRLEVETTA